MSAETVTYEETDEATAYMEKFSPEHLKRLAMEQAQENASDPAHIAKVNALVERIRRGEAIGEPLTAESLRRKLQL